MSQTAAAGPDILQKKERSRNPSMEYLITFLEGLITFISPCLLPMLPIYLSYLMGGAAGGSKLSAFKNALGFVLGFTVTFVALGAFAGSVGSLLQHHQTAVNIVSGLIVVLFGLHFLGLFQLKLFRGLGSGASVARGDFLSSILFGLVFSVGWTPCVGAFLGSALMLASQQGSALKGVTLLLAYSLGLGVPFLLSALLLDQLKSAFDWIKRHYRPIQFFSGGLLIVVGIAMMTGLMGRLLSVLAI